MRLTPDQLMEAQKNYAQEKKEFEESWTPERKKELRAIVDEKLRVLQTGTNIPLTKEEQVFLYEGSFLDVKSFKF